MFLRKKNRRSIFNLKKNLGFLGFGLKTYFSSIFDPKSLEKTLNSLINPQMTIKQKKNHTKPRNQLEIKKNSSELRYGF
jgi:hypothetical protein